MGHGNQPPVGYPGGISIAVVAVSSFAYPPVQISEATAVAVAQNAAMRFMGFLFDERLARFRDYVTRNSKSDIAMRHSAAPIGDRETVTWAVA
jgi:hypothetical protein